MDELTNPQLLIRSAPLEDVELGGSDGRTVIARMMLWDHPNRVTDDGVNFYDEVWRKGVFSSSIRRAEKSGKRWPLLIVHQDRLLPVGAATAVHERSDGPYFMGKISNTQAGNEIIELIRDGALPGVSVGAKPIRSKRTAQTVERIEAALREISFTPFAALMGAEVMALRSMTAVEPEDDEEDENGEGESEGSEDAKATLDFVNSLALPEV